ncbi:MAG: fatty acid desaturase [Gammaproteobacteria bacterium]
MIYGLLDLPWWGYVIATLVMTHITIVGVTLFLHRSQAHRACDFHPIVSHFFRFWLWLTTGMVTKEFVAIHRKHHAKCETEDDPHSPQVLGIETVLWRGVECYRAESLNKETIERYGSGTPDDWMERNVYTKRSVYGVLLMLILDLVFFGVPGLTVWAIQMMWIPFFATGVINGIGHYWGYRNYEIPDASTNVLPWGILIGGEELHNNHHTFGTAAKLSIKPWEFDIGWLYLRIMKFFGLVKIKRMPSKLVSQPGKCTIDAETITAVFSNRFEVLTNYTREVLMPIYFEEKTKAGECAKQLYAKTKRLFKREPSLVNEKGKVRINEVLAANERLSKVYNLRQSLQDIWCKTQISQKEFIEALQAWCQQAEASGIESLREFVNKLKSYTLANKAKVA